MLKTVIFDDEYIVIQGLQAMIDWPKYGIEVVGTASDGLSALRMFRSLRPDIVMTDVRMPGLDGLQVIEEILTEAPETVCIVFSGFNEFDYIRTALKLGVVDYLEKPVTIEKVDEAMRRTIERIGRQREHADLRTKLEASQEALLEKAALDLLLHGEEALPGWRQAIGEPEADRIAGVTVLAASERGEPQAEHPSFRTLTLPQEKHWLTVVFHYELPADPLWEQLLLQSTHWQGALGSGRTYARVAEAGRSLKEALRALRYGLFLEGKGWTRFEHADESEHLPDGLTEREEELIFYMRTGNKEGLLENLRSFERWVESERLDPDTVEREMLKLAYLGQQVAKESDRGSRLDRKQAFVSHRELEGMHSREEMFLWLRKHMETLLDLTLRARQSSQHNGVDKALAYIEENYRQDLTLQEVAEHVGMNATYFSLLFKEKVGISYIKHVTKLRLEHAMQLLRRGLKVNEASRMVGYYNYRHFNDLFKKYYGVTPGSYRESAEAIGDAGPAKEGTAR